MVGMHAHPLLKNIRYNETMIQRQRRVQKNMIIAFGLSGIILTGILSVLTSHLMARFLVDQSVENATQSLNVATQGTQTLLDDLISEYVFLFNEQAVIQQFTIADSTSVSNLTTFLSQTALADPLVDAILYYNLSEGSVVYSNNASGLLTNLAENELTVSLNQTLSSFQLNPTRLFHHQKINQAYVLALTLASYDDVGVLDRLMIIHLNDDVLSSLFTAPNSNYEILIINEDNVVIADSAQQWLGQSFPSSLSYSNPLEIDAKSKFVLNQFDNSQSLMVYSKMKNYNLIFFHVTPYEVIQSTIISANRIIIALFMVFVLINLIVSYVLSQRFYAPIQSMVHQFVKQDYHDAKDEFELIESAFVDLNLTQQSTQLKSLFSSSLIEPHIDVSFITFPLRVVVALISQQNKVINGWIKMSEGVFAYVFRDQDLNQLEKIQSAKLGVSDLCLSIEGLRASYRSALAAAQYADTLDKQNIVYYSDIYQSEYLTSKTILMNEVMNYLSNHGYSSSFTFEALADACGFSLGYIRQVFKETQGNAMNEYLISMRINKAKELIETTSMSGKEISEAVGYNEPRYFYTQFKQRVNMTVESYRTLIKEKHNED